jgi:cytochrome c oxidase subunit 3
MIFGSAALLCMATGAASWFNGWEPGRYLVLLGLAILVFMMVRWFGDVIRESEGGKYGRWEDVSFRWGMSWFIFSEVMFFAAFFGALYYARQLAMPDLGSLDNKLLCLTSRRNGLPRARSSRIPSRPWRPGGSPQSTRCCCCPRA